METAYRTEMRDSDTDDEYIYSAQTIKPKLIFLDSQVMLQNPPPLERVPSFEADTPPATKVPMVKIADKKRSTFDGERSPEMCPNFEALVSPPEHITSTGCETKDVAPSDPDQKTHSGPAIADAYRDVAPITKRSEVCGPTSEWIAAEPRFGRNEVARPNEMPGEPNVHVGWEFSSSKAVVRIRTPHMSLTIPSFVVYVIDTTSFEGAAMRHVWAHVKLACATGPRGSAFAIITIHQEGSHIFRTNENPPFPSEIDSKGGAKEVDSCQKMMARLSEAQQRAIRMISIARKQSQSATSSALYHIVMIASDAIYYDEAAPIVPAAAMLASSEAQAENISVWAVAIGTRSITPRGELLHFFNILSAGTSTFIGTIEDDIWSTLKNPLWGAFNAIHKLAHTEISIELSAPNNSALLIRSRGGAEMKTLSPNSVKLRWSMVGSGSERFCLIDVSPDAEGPVFVRLLWNDGRAIAEKELTIRMPTVKNALQIPYATASLIAHASQLLKRAAETDDVPSANAIILLLRGCIPPAPDASARLERIIRELTTQNWWNVDACRKGVLTFWSRSLYKE